MSGRYRRLGNYCNEEQVSAVKEDNGDSNASPTVILTEMHLGGGWLFGEPRDDGKKW